MCWAGLGLGRLGLAGWAGLARRGREVGRWHGCVTKGPGECRARGTVVTSDGNPEMPPAIFSRCNIGPLRRENAFERRHPSRGQSLTRRLTSQNESVATESDAIRNPHPESRSSANRSGAWRPPGPSAGTTMSDDVNMLPASISSSRHATSTRPARDYLRPTDMVAPDGSGDDILVAMERRAKNRG